MHRDLLVSYERTIAGRLGELTNLQRRISTLYSVINAGQPL